MLQYHNIICRTTRRRVNRDLVALILFSTKNDDDDNYIDCRQAIPKLSETAVAAASLSLAELKRELAQYQYSIISRDRAIPVK